MAVLLPESPLVYSCSVGTPKPSPSPHTEKLQVFVPKGNNKRINYKQESYKLSILPDAVAVFHEPILLKLLPNWSFSNALIRCFLKFLHHFILAFFGEQLPDILTLLLP